MCTSWGLLQGEMGVQAGTPATVCAVCAVGHAPYAAGCAHLCNTARTTCTAGHAMGHAGCAVHTVPSHHPLPSTAGALMAYASSTVTQQGQGWGYPPDPKGEQDRPRPGGGSPHPCVNPFCISPISSHTAPRPTLCALGGQRILLSAPQKQNPHPKFTFYTVAKKCSNYDTHGVKHTVSKCPQLTSLLPSSQQPGHLSHGRTPQP